MLFQTLSEGIWELEARSELFRGAWTRAHVSNEADTVADPIVAVHSVLVACPASRVEPSNCGKNGGCYRPGVEWMTPL
jgi:hypothetical protein